MVFFSYLFIFFLPLSLVLEAICVELTIAEIASRQQIHTTMTSSQIRYNVGSNDDIFVNDVDCNAKRQKLYTSQNKGFKLNSMNRSISALPQLFDMIKHFHQI